MQLLVDHDGIAVVRLAPYVGQASVDIVHSRVAYFASNEPGRRQVWMNSKQSDGPRRKIERSVGKKFSLEVGAWSGQAHAATKAGQSRLLLNSILRSQARNML